MYIGLAVDEAILALWMIFWRGLVSFAVEPFALCILKPLVPLTATLEGVSIFITVSLGEVGCFSDPTSNQNSLIILHENSILTYFFRLFLSAKSDDHGIFKECWQCN